MKRNENKCHPLVSGRKYENVRVKMRKKKIWNSAKQKFIEMETGTYLNFDGYMSSLLKKTGRKLAVFGRLSKLMGLKQKQTFIEKVVESQ